MVSDIFCNFAEELEDGIFELRAKSGSDISRVLYFFMIGRIIVLTNGFIKKTQKTPKNEIEKANHFSHTSCLLCRRSCRGSDRERSETACADGDTAIFEDLRDFQDTVLNTSFGKEQLLNNYWYFLND